jgi:formylglycine-generating enzyme
VASYQYHSPRYPIKIPLAQIIIFPYPCKKQPIAHDFMAKQQESKGLKIRPAKPASNPARKNHLLIVGIDQYADTSIRKLNNACKDARDLVAILQADYGFLPEHTHELYDQDATRAKILEKLDAIAEQFHPKGKDEIADNLIVYFSGHGHYNPRTKLGYFIPHDGKVAELASTFLQHGNFRDHLSAIQAHHLTLFLDTCFSGSVCVKRGKGDYKNSNEARPSRRVLTSGLLEEVADGYRLDNSPFAKAMLTFLQTTEKDAFSFAELAQFVEERVAENAQQTAYSAVLQGTEQHLSGQFFFQKIEKEKPDEKALREAWDNIDALEEFIHEFPDSLLRAQARARLRELREDQAWKNALRRNRIEDYDEFIDDYPTSPKVPEAREKIKALREQKKQNLPKPTPDPIPEKPEPITPPTIIIPAGPDFAAIDQALNMVRISGGKFLMGDTFGDNHYEDEKPVHEVAVSPFALGKYAVTLGDFAQFIEKTKYQTDADKNGGSYLWGPKAANWGLTAGVTWRCGVDGRTRPNSEANHPVIHVSWNDALAYCNWLSQAQGLDSVYDTEGPLKCNWQNPGFRLPTEAEWEFAASMGNGKKTRFGNGKDIANPVEMNFGATKAAKPAYSLVGEYRQNTVPVGGLNCPNGFGLHDLSGNVWEWCWDWLDEKYYEKSPANNPHGPDAGSFRAIRGGSWVSRPQNCRVAYRSNYAPGIRRNDLGFRLARTVTL